ncbi:hypothetical protein GCK72_025488 [Caenorhabditis remanei]|uniref:ILCR1 Ig-like domain-containing protein n=1 Tax=Caenorhabditis remanei TaxID=31234 RepID=A0A6A5G2Q8_CAERE|nr:hypothetical protein GCK72_025488 [Caenorhabditis remanei]KAF1749021.1 hypothetical protein GCK72_025488 [Caenorhabditis remanei]
MRYSRPLLALATVILLFQLPSSDASTACSFNGNGNCSVNTETDEVMDLLNDGQNQTINWKIRPQNIGFMYYLRTSDDGDDLGVRGIVKWKVQLKNWSTNDTAVEGFLVSIMDHDSNETVTSYELTISEPFEQFAAYNDVLEMRLELDDILSFDKRYDAKINILPIGKQAAASSFLSIMGKLEGEKCSAMTGLAERWAPHVIVDVFETTSEVELTWQPAPSFLCIKTYEVVLQNRDGFILNTTEIEVIPGQKIANATFQGIEKDQMVQVKVRGKNALDGGCACVNCNCITDKTKFFLIPNVTKENPPVTTPKPVVHHEPYSFTGFYILLIVFGTAAFFIALICLCVCCVKRHKRIFKQKIAFSALKTSQHNKKVTDKKQYKIMVVCPEITGKDYEYMMKIADGLRKSSNTVVCDKWGESANDVEENMLHYVYKQTGIAEKIIVFHSSSYMTRVGVYEIIENYFPSTDPRLVHIALSPSAQRKVPCGVEYVMPRDQKHFEEAFDIFIEHVIEISPETEVVPDAAPVHRDSCESIVEEQQNNSKTHSTDSGVSSMSSNSSDSEGAIDANQSDTELPMKDAINVESHPLLPRPIAVS